MYYSQSKWHIVLSCRAFGITHDTDRNGKKRISVQYSKVDVKAYLNILVRSSDVNKLSLGEIGQFEMTEEMWKSTKMSVTYFLKKWNLFGRLKDKFRIRFGSLFMGFSLRYKSCCCFVTRTADSAQLRQFGIENRNVRWIGEFSYWRT